eukprot:GHUV01052035.1.p1 GENE.GHUV01052035.1~~GHUV01052035.1.p1  ORF type:complete len:162 (-),score=36.05 GHUV01052035.1:130-615(-)
MPAAYTPYRAVIRLLPHLAAFAPERFAQDYLHKCIAHLLAVLKHTGERGTAFAALADMAGSLAAVGCQEGFEPYLPAIAAQLRESLAVRTKGKPGSNVTEALQCVGVLASALHVSWQPFAQQLLDCMMHTGPSQVGHWGIQSLHIRVEIFSSYQKVVKAVR